MKIVCPNCGKKYNYEKNMGVCPACTKYTSFVDVQKQIAGINSGYNTQSNNSSNYVSPPGFPYDDHHQHHKEEPKEDYSYGFGAPQQDPYQTDYQNQYYQDQQNYQDQYYQGQQNYQHQYQTQYAAPRQPTHPIVIGIVLVFCLLIVFSFVIAINVVAPAKINELNEYQKVKDVALSTANVAEQVQIEDIFFTIEQPEVFYSELFAAPEGWKYIIVPFTSAREYYSRDYRYLDIFLNINGVYVPALSQYNIPEYDFDDPFISTQIDELGIENSIWGQESGHLLFLIKEDESEYTLTIYTYLQESKSNSRLLESKLEIAINENVG